MTVKELIKKLQELDQDVPIRVWDREYYEHGEVGIQECKETKNKLYEILSGAADPSIEYKG